MPEYLIAAKNGKSVEKQWDRHSLRLFSSSMASQKRQSENNFLWKYALIENRVGPWMKNIVQYNIYAFNCLSTGSFLGCRLRCRCRVCYFGCFVTIFFALFVLCLVFCWHAEQNNTVSRCILRKILLKIRMFNKKRTETHTECDRKGQSKWTIWNGNECEQERERSEGKGSDKDYLSFCIFQYNGFSCQTNNPIWKTHCMTPNKHWHRFLLMR